MLLTRQDLLPVSTLISVRFLKVLLQNAAVLGLKGCANGGLELSREEPRSEDQEAEQQVQEELQEVELHVRQLAAQLQAWRRPVDACIARVQALRRALC